MKLPKLFFSVIRILVQTQKYFIQSKANLHVRKCRSKVIRIKTLKSDCMHGAAIKMYRYTLFIATVSGHGAIGC